MPPRRISVVVTTYNWPQALEKVLRALERGDGQAGDLETLEQLVTSLGPGRTFCAHAPGAVEPLGSALKYFRPEFEAGIAKQAAAVPA